MTDAVYNGATTERVKQCPNCECQFEDWILHTILDESSQDILRNNDENAEVWLSDLKEFEKYFHCKKCHKYWIDMDHLSFCPKCSARICYECWENVDGDCGCQCGTDELSSEAEARSVAVIRKCPRCRTPFVKNDDECNHVTCSVCQANICYFCGEYVEGDIYKIHFGDVTKGMCPVYSSRITLHDERANAAAARFKRKE
jgi:hypothetical protein